MWLMDYHTTHAHVGQSSKTMKNPEAPNTMSGPQAPNKVKSPSAPNIIKNPAAADTTKNPVAPNTMKSLAQAVKEPLNEKKEKGNKSNLFWEPCIAEKLHQIPNFCP